MVTVHQVGPIEWEFAWGSAMDDLLDLVDQGWELIEQDDPTKASKTFRKVIAAEPDLMDAYVGLAKVEWDRGRLKAARHQYEHAVSIGLAALPIPFEGTLPWGLIGNRPFLRALHGLGLTLLETGDRVSAQVLFRWGLRLNPEENQGFRFLLADLMREKA